MSSYALLATSIAFVLASCGGGGSTPAVAAQPTPTFPTFVEVTAAAGIDLAHGAIPSYRTTGTAWGDYDRDGDLDLYLTNQNGPNRLYRNRGDGSFEISPVQASVELATHASGGCVFADYDNDGWPDLYVCGLGPDVLLHNDGGTGFTNVTAAAGVGDGGMSMTASWGDYNGDGFLDLFVSNWLCGSCPGDILANMADRLYRNNRNGTFSDVTSFLGAGLTRGYGFVGCFVDYDDDGDADLYVVNDRGSAGPLVPGQPVNRNMLFRNDGPGSTFTSWSFTEVGIAAGADSRIDGMGLGICDYDNDGDQDFAMSDNRPPTVLQNLGNGRFDSVAGSVGVVGDAITWGVLWEDFSNDRFGDLYFASSSGPGLFYENRRDGTFADVSLSAGLASRFDAMGCACADFDADGWLDVVIGEHGSGFRLFRSQGLPVHPGWLRVRLEGSGAVNRDAVGAKVRLHTVDGVVQTREVRCGSSLGAGNDLALHFGLGGVSIDRVEIRWPDGVVETISGIAPNQEWRHRKP